MASCKSLEFGGMHQTEMCCIATVNDSTTISLSDPAGVVESAVANVHSGDGRTCGNARRWLLARPILQEYDAFTVEELGVNPVNQFSNLTDSGFGNMQAALPYGNRRSVLEGSEIFTGPPQMSTTL